MAKCNCKSKNFIFAELNAHSDNCEIIDEAKHTIKIMESANRPLNGNITCCVTYKHCLSECDKSQLFERVTIVNVGKGEYYKKLIRNSKKNLKGKYEEIISNTYTFNDNTTKVKDFQYIDSCSYRITIENC